MNRALAVLVLLAFAACGHSPTAPAPPADCVKVDTTTFTLADGRVGRLIIEQHHSCAPGEMARH